MERKIIAESFGPWPGAPVRGICSNAIIWGEDNMPNVISERITPIAAKIWADLGGWDFDRSVQPKDYYCYTAGIDFRINSRFTKDRINKIDIQLTPSGDYKILFLRKWGKKMDTIAIHYVEPKAIRRIFTEYTGLEIK